MWLLQLSVVISFIIIAQGDELDSFECKSDNFNGPFVLQLTDPLEHGECPTWDSDRDILYFVDIHVGMIYSYNYHKKRLHNITLNGEVAPVLKAKARRDNVLIVGVNRSLVAVEWDGKSSHFSQKNLTSVAADKPTSRFNDGKVDRKGRIWIGTMGFETLDGKLTPNDGALYVIEKNVAPRVAVAPVNISNGLAWNRANNKLYYIDTPTFKIVSYDYECKTGEISNKKVVFDLQAHNVSGAPDGMTIDKDDNLWVALYGGGSVIKVNPTTGKLLQRIAIPAESVTSVMFGGPELNILFVTTSRYGLSKSQLAKQPAAGAVFAITKLKTHGLPMNRAKIL